MTKIDLATQIGQKVNKTDSSTLAIIKDFLSQRHAFIYNHHSWREAQATYTKSVAASTPEIILPHWMEKVIAVKTDNTPLKPIENSTLIFTDPAMFDRVGSVSLFVNKVPVACSILPTDERMNIVSSSSSDTSKYVEIRGQLNGVEYRETVTLTGTTSVMTTNSYDEVYQLSKSETTGSITVTGATSGVTLQTLWPEENERVHQRILLYASPQEATTAFIHGKRIPKPFKNDNDTPSLSNIDDCLIDFALMDTLEYLRQYQKAAIAGQRAMASLAELVSNDLNQSARILQLVPDDDGSADINDW